MEQGVLVSFDSTQQALRAELLLEYGGVDIDIQPTPKAITAGCAMSIAIPAAALDNARHILQTEQVETEGFYWIRDGHYVRITSEITENGKE